MIVMKSSQAGFYRTKPLLSNVFCFALECWNLALTAGSVTARLAKFVVATSIYVGRIDTPVLAEDLLLNLDKFPVLFRKDLLATDAHHHPYIELLGTMYMMKLRHKGNFGKTSGSMWRLLFVVALMPWLKKYRIQDELNVEDEDLLKKIKEMSDVKKEVIEN
mmetsp:Transcript_3330/g.3675  ORF Transcript_3330/g.3675 Transcript_3330/m.3675 type:complete len:162 (-) Transcript_3330:128-613(-)